MIMQQLGIYGWKEADENLVLASLLTGDPLLLIGNHGCAKTHVANKVAQALGRKFLVYDASKAMFEDVLGYPNVEKLKHGLVEYVPSPVTIWDKELVLIDELNRAVPELQSKYDIVSIMLAACSSSSRKRPTPLWGRCSRQTFPPSHPVRA